MRNKTIHILIFYFLFINISFSQEVQLIDSLKLKLQTSQGEQRVMDLCGLCYELKYQDANEARKYCEEALSLSQQLNYKKGKATALQHLGVTLQGQGSYEKAAEYLLEALDLFEQMKDTLAIAKTQNNIGIVFDEKADYKKAIERYFLALEIYEQRHDKLGIAQAYNNIGIVYKKQKNYPKVIEYYQKALAIYQDYGHGFGIAVCQGNIGSVFLNMENYQKAIEFSKQSVAAYDSLKIFQYKPYPLGNIGRAYNGMKNYNKAIPFLLDALRLHEEYGNKKEIAFTKNNLAEAYFYTNQIQKAKKESLQSLAIAKEIGTKEEIRNAYLTLSKIYKKENNYQQALASYQNYTAIKDTLFESEKTKAIAELQTQYETAQKEQTIQLQKLKIEKVETKNKTITIASLATFLTLILLAAFVYFYYKNKQETVQQQKELDHQQKLIETTFAATEEERKRIARDLHDGVGQQLTGLKMAWQQLEKKLANGQETKATNIRQLTKILDDATNDVRTISHQMMPKSLSEFGLVAAVEDMLEKTFVPAGVQYSFDEFGIKNRFDEKIEIAVFRIAQELVNNILKHSEAKEVEIQLYQTKQHLILSIQDDGKGISNNNTNTNGHGMMNMQSRAKSLGAKINFENGDEGGLATILRVPIPHP